MLRHAIAGARRGRGRRRRWWWRWRRWFLRGRERGGRRSARISRGAKSESRRGSRAGGVARISWTSRQSEQRGGSTRNFATVIGHHRASRDAWRCLRQCGARIKSRSWRGIRASGVARISWTSRQSEQHGGSPWNYATVIGHHRDSRDARHCLKQCGGGGCQQRQPYRSVDSSRIGWDRRSIKWIGVRGAKAPTRIVP